MASSSGSEVANCKDRQRQLCLWLGGKRLTHQQLSINMKFSYKCLCFVYDMISSFMLWSLCFGHMKNLILCSSSEIVVSCAWLIVKSKGSCEKYIMMFSL